jgi:phage terminase large subunit-like protein
MPYYVEKAERVKRFIEKYCTYSKGEWAGQPFVLLPWQWEDVISPLFGTMNDNGARQYRTCYIEIPKKNGKSELCAALSLYLLTNDGEEGAEVYLAASDREQAGIIYQAAAAMVNHSEDLSGHLKRLDSRKRIIYAKKNSFLQVLSSESYTKHGISPSAVIIDEIHAHPTGELYEVLTAGTDYARRQQVVLIVTTAGIYDKNSIWWRIRTRAQQIKSGIIEDPRFLPVLYIADPENDDPENEELWKRVNPSMGQIFTMDKIRQDYQEAKQNPIDFQNFKRFRLNIPIRQLSKWMPMDKWDKCDGEVDMASLEGRKCAGGLDMSLKIDMTAFVLVFSPKEGDDVFDVICKFYCPEEGILLRSRRDRVPYDLWQRQGHIIATPGETVDDEFIKKDIIDLVKKYQIDQIGFDSWKATSVHNHIMAEFNPMNREDGFQMVEIRQGARSMHEPAQDLLAKVINGKISHGGNPILRWNMDNMVMRADPNENLAPDKAKAVERIDGAVALIMAWSRIMFMVEATSQYDSMTAEQIKERMSY